MAPVSPVHPHRCLFVFNGFAPHPKCNICHVLWYKSPHASVRRCGSSSVHEDRIRLLRAWGNGLGSTNRTSPAGTSKHWATLAGSSHRRTNVCIWPNLVDPANIPPRYPRTLQLRSLACSNMRKGGWTRGGGRADDGRDTYNR